MGLQLVVELNQVDDVLKVLHEFLVIDAAVTVDISHNIEGQGLFPSEVELSELLEALLELTPFKEAVVVNITLSEGSEHISFLNCGHLHVACAELSNRHQLRLAAHRFDLVHSVDSLAAHLRERFVIDIGLFVRVRVSKNQVNLEGG